MAVRVVCQRCQRNTYFFAADLIAYGAASLADLDDLRFRCARCDGRKTRVHAVDLNATPSGFIVVERLPPRRRI